MTKIPSFGFISGGAGGAASTPNWQQVTTAGNTTTNDIFVQDVSANNYLRVDKTGNGYFLGSPILNRGISLDGTARFYKFGENTGVNITISSGTPTSISFAGTTIYQFNDGIEAYASGDYSSMVLQTTGSPNALQIQPKDMVPVVTKNGVSYTATSNDCVILVSPVSVITPTTITLPTTVLPGKRFYIKRTGGSVNVIIDPAGGATIDGAANYTISTLYECIQCVFDGTNYSII